MSLSVKVRLLVVCNPEIFRLGLVTLIEEMPNAEVVGQGATMRSALSDPSALRADVIVLDRWLPDASGLDTCRDLLHRTPDKKVIILTTEDYDQTAQAAARAGAHACLTHDVAGGHFTSVVEDVMSGETRLDPSDQRVPIKPARDLIDTLTPQETRVFRLLAEGLTNQQIGNRLFLAEKTVRNHVTSILAKLGIQRRTQAALYAQNTLLANRVQGQNAY